ncbi:MAG: FAD-dependent oxidoreductase, partial [Paramuribaculum sp.]|nr:FAD-dependent oxidoreductase [Paramuribaculum sp.]
VLKYGIPEFRLPNSVVDHEINTLRELGVSFVKDMVIGKTLSHADLEDMGFKGIFVGSGAGLPRFMGIPGENLIGVMSSNEYLTRVNLMGAGRTDAPTPVTLGHRAAIIGGGNTAMDSARTARRMGAEKVYVVYRRGEAEMPARIEEVAHAKEEGIEFLTLHNPLEYLGDEKGRVTTMRLQRMELGEPDESGRRSPVPVPGAVSDVEVDMVIVSVGVSPNPLIPEAMAGLDITRRGTIVVDEATMRTSLPDVYAGGDIVRGGATVILAMGDGRRAAAAMAEALTC